MVLTCEGVSYAKGGGRLVLEDGGLLSFSLLPLSLLSLFGFHRFEGFSAGQSVIHSFIRLFFACIPTFIRSFTHSQSVIHSFRSLLAKLLQSLLLLARCHSFSSLYCKSLFFSATSSQPAPRLLM